MGNRTTNLQITSLTSEKSQTPKPPRHRGYNMDTLPVSFQPNGNLCEQKLCARNQFKKHRNQNNGWKMGKVYFNHSLILKVQTVAYCEVK